MEIPEPSSLLILGLGNVLCSDDGLGVAAVRELQAQYRWPENVRVLDGGTMGLSLLSLFSGGEDVLMLDAVAVDQPPGSLVRIDGDEVVPAVQHRLSVHQIGVVDLLAGLHLVGAFPRRLVLLGMVPESLGLGVDLSPAVQAGMPRLLETVGEEARSLGYSLERPSESGTDEDDSDGELDRLSLPVLGL